MLFRVVSAHIRVQRFDVAVLAALCGFKTTSIMIARERPEGSSE